MMENRARGQYFRAVREKLQLLRDAAQGRENKQEIIQRLDMCEGELSVVESLFTVETLQAQKHEQTSAGRPV